jgi:ubiquinone/menaquinone biosynthesis C-methylase UbiE
LSALPDNLALLTSESLDLLERHLPPPPARVLEVGCGAGDLSCALQQRGYDVHALDRSEENVERARAKGVEATAASWPDFVDLPFDAILFTRSLHHIQPVTIALRRAHELLADGGTLIVEDFAYHEASTRTILWFKNMVDVLDAAGVLNHADERFASRIAHAEDALQAWQLDHTGIAPAAEMHFAIQSTFTLRAGAQTPHLYRYVSQIAKPEVADSVVAAVLKAERAAQGARAIDPVGRLWVAVK